MSSFSHPSLSHQSSRFNRRNSKERIFGKVVSLDAFAKAFANVWKARANFKGQGQANATTRKTRKTLKPVKSRKNILADEGSAHGGKTFHHITSEYIYLHAVEKGKKHDSTVLRILLSLLSYLEVLEFGLSSARAQALAAEALTSCCCCGSAASSRRCS